MTILQPGEYRSNRSGTPREPKRKRLMTIKLTDCPYADDIKRAMQAYVPQWPWVYGVAQQYQESRWNPAAKSEAGAMGLAQFMPDTWQDVIDGMGFPDGATPFEPMYAIPAQAWYLRKLRTVWSRVDRTEAERRRLTLASYNCGTGNMLKAQRLAQGVTDYAGIIAALPHITGLANAAQTADYVVKIERWYLELTSTQA